MKNFSRKRIYGDANISRVMDTVNFKSRREQIEYTKRIWNNRNVIIVEGDKTRFGVGNDLLNESITVDRILGPAESAFDKMYELLEVVEKTSCKYIEPIVILALGPTATVMAVKLQEKGIQAIDIGHLDICYEVSMQIGIDSNKIPVPRDHIVAGKYTNEAKGGNIVSECNDLEYLSQIVYDCNKKGI